VNLFELGGKEGDLPFLFSKNSMIFFMLSGKLRYSSIISGVGGG